MTKIEKLEREIRGLTAKELATFREWFAAFDAAAWDRQLEKDAKAGTPPSPITADPRHPSLHFKRVGRLHSVRVGAHHRALAVDASDGVLWFWIGSHADYDRIVG